MVRIASVTREEVGDEVFEKLVQVSPEGVYDHRRRIFDFCVDAPDDRIDRVLRLLESAGLKPHPLTQHDSNDDLYETLAEDEFLMAIHRSYTERELARFRLLCPQPRWQWQGLWRFSNGEIGLDHQDYAANCQHDVLATECGIVISSRAKVVLDSLNLKRLVIKSTSLADLRAGWNSSPISWAKYGDPFWELTSDLILPPVVPPSELVDNDGQPVHGKLDNGCHLREGLYHEPELHYRPKDIVQLPEFDFALTFEQFGNNPAEDDRMLVASAKLVEVCQKNKIQCDCVPVRIDP